MYSSNLVAFLFFRNVLMMIENLSKHVEVIYSFQFYQERDDKQFVLSNHLQIHEQDKRFANRGGYCATCFFFLYLASLYFSISETFVATYIVR